MCVLNGRLYAVGGIVGSAYLSSVERYDEGKDQWEMVASMNSERFVVGVCVLLWLRRENRDEFGGLHHLFDSFLPASSGVID